MRIDKLILLLFIFLFLACKSNSDKTSKSDKSNKGETSNDNNSMSKKGEIINELNIENGIKITYFEKGNGDSLYANDVVKINYEVYLKDGKFVDGNKLLKKSWLPFIIGFQLQTIGWDIAFKKLRVGDSVEIYLPSKMARGAYEIKGLIPAHSDNYIKVKVLGKINPTRVIDGTKVWVLEENKTEKPKAKLENIVEFHYMVSTPSNPKYDISYRKNLPYTLKFSDFGIIKGLKKALLTCKRSDKLWVWVPAKEAYGNKGLKGLIKPNEPIFYDIFVMDVR
jgi:FKBP-type peptidyl-prolyl cis-trans isomerase